MIWGKKFHQWNKEWHELVMYFKFSITKFFLKSKSSGLRNFVLATVLFLPSQSLRPYLKSYFLRDISFDYLWLLWLLWHLPKSFCIILSLFIFFSELKNIWNHLVYSFVFLSHLHYSSEIYTSSRKLPVLVLTSDFPVSGTFFSHYRC